MNIKLYFISLIFLELSFSLHLNAQIVKVPEGIIYKQGSDKNNNIAKEIVKRELSDKPKYSLFDKHLYCGPSLWNRYKEIKDISAISGGNLQLKVPTFDSTGKKIKETVMVGKLIQNEKDFKLIWDQIIKDFKGSDYTFRKLNKNELQYYWAIIFFDIEDPIFVIENKKYSIIIDINEDKLIWLDETR